LNKEIGKKGAEGNFLANYPGFGYNAEYLEGVND
jgi:hypothetical protein